MKNSKGPFGERLYFLNKVPQNLLNSKNTYWFIDDVFKNHKGFKSLEKKVFLKSGESLKTLKTLEKNIKTLQGWGVTKNSTVVVVGGGSLGDSIGFLASVYLRGVALVHVPTTWLAAVDSSIGGKTALNFQSYKNQIGSFYPPKAIYFVKNLIETSSKEEALGEVYKTLFLNPNKSWAKNLLYEPLNFESLQDFVMYKTRVVKKDPLDSKGLRAVLNLGHSLGHVLELKYKLCHGDAVLYGLRFAVLWSHKLGHLSHKKMQTYLETLPVYPSYFKNLKQEVLLKHLKKDKKVKKAKISFVFVSDKGPIVLEKTLASLAKEYQRQVDEV